MEVLAAVEGELEALTARWEVLEEVAGAAGG